MNWMFMPYRRYADFSGRSTRREFWMFQLFISLVYLVAYLLIFMGLDTATGEVSALSYIFAVALGVFAIASFIPAWAVFFRRLHDTDRSGWNWLWSLLPVVGQIVLFVFLCSEGTPGPNRFGPNPLGRVDEEVFA